MKVFLDTNVLVYAVDATDPDKNAKAVSIIQAALRDRRSYAVSTQALSEFANVAIGKLAMAPDAVLDFLRIFLGLSLVAPDSSVVVRGVELKALHGIHFYDAMMVAAAESAGATEFWSEDLNPGQRYAGILVRNPFGKP